MEQVLQLNHGDRSTENTRTFRGLNHVLSPQGISISIKPKAHQLYDLVWRRLQVDLYGGAINADEPGFGKVNIPSPFVRLDHLIRMSASDSLMCILFQTLMLLMSWIFERQLTLRWDALEGYFDITTIEAFEKSPFARKHLPPWAIREDKQSQCPSAKMLDVACPCEDEANHVYKMTPKPGIFLVIVLAKTLANWLAEITKLIDLEDREVMQLRVFYAHGSVRYHRVSAEPLTPANAKLLQCTDTGETQGGQERFLVLTTPESYKNHVKAMIKGTGKFGHNFTIGQIHVDECHNTNSDTATTFKLIYDYKTEQSSIVTRDPAYPRNRGEHKQDYHERIATEFKRVLPYACGYSATPWIKSFTDMAAIVLAIE